MKNDNANGVLSQPVVSRKGYFTGTYTEKRPSPGPRNVQQGFARGASVGKGKSAAPIPLTSNTPIA